MQHNNYNVTQKTNIMYNTISHIKYQDSIQLTTCFLPKPT